MHRKHTKWTGKAHFSVVFTMLFTEMAVRPLPKRCCCTCSICSVDTKNYRSASILWCFWCFGMPPALYFFILVTIMQTDSGVLQQLQARLWTSASGPGFHLHIRLAKFQDELLGRSLFETWKYRSAAFSRRRATPALPFWPKAFAGRSQPTTCANMDGINLGFQFKSTTNTYVWCGNKSSSMRCSQDQHHAWICWRLWLLSSIAIKPSDMVKHLHARGHLGSKWRQRHDGM